MSRTLLLGAAIAICAGCASARPAAPPAAANGVEPSMSVKDRLEQYTTVRLDADLRDLGADERKMIAILIDAARAMDDIFWLQAYGDPAPLLTSVSDPALRRLLEINYGPWDRLDGDAPLLPSVGPKPEGARFYPEDMTKEEFERAIDGDPARTALFKSEYTLIRRGPDRTLQAVPYHEAYAERTRHAADRLREAAALAADPGLKRYLELRAEALLTDRYRDSDLAWLDMKTNRIDVVIGPIETYEDRLFGSKAAHEAYVLVKDMEWSRRLARYASLLPDLQRGLPVPEAYKAERPGTDSDLNAYDAVYYAGHCNAGSKTIAINLPNDESVQLEKGTRRLQLKNAMRAKFDAILQPIAGVLIAPDQRRHVTFDAFFGTVMFHEVAHGLGIKNTVNGRGSVRDALREEAGALEEGKADILGLHMITRLHERGELGAAPLEDSYVTFLAGIFRSIRFGATSAHGQANLARFHFFEQQGAFTRDERTGTYRVDFARMRQAVDALSERILRLQGDGDYQGVKRFMAELGRMDPALRADLDRLARAEIPVDIVFEQGASVLGL